MDAVDHQQTDTRSSLLIETEEFAELIAKNTANLKIINGSASPPGSGLDVLAEHQKARIGNDSVLFDHEVICEPGS